MSGDVTDVLQNPKLTRVLGQFCCEFDGNPPKCSGNFAGSSMVTPPEVLLRRAGTAVLPGLLVLLRIRS